MKSYNNLEELNGVVKDNFDLNNLNCSKIVSDLFTSDDKDRRTELTIELFSKIVEEMVKISGGMAEIDVNGIKNDEDYDEIHYMVNDTIDKLTELTAAHSKFTEIEVLDEEK